MWHLRATNRRLSGGQGPPVYSKGQHNEAEILQSCSGGQSKAYNRGPGECNKRTTSVWKVTFKQHLSSYIKDSNSKLDIRIRTWSAILNIRLSMAPSLEIYCKYVLAIRLCLAKMVKWSVNGHCYLKLCLQGHQKSGCWWQSYKG